MKDSSGLLKRSSKEQDEVRRTKRKAKKRRRDESLSSSSDSQDVRRRKKQKRKESKRKRARSPSRKDEFLRKKKKGLRKSEGEFRKKTSKVKLKKKKIRRIRRDSTETSSKSYSLSESCSTCRDHYSSEEGSHRSKKLESGREEPSKREHTRKGLRKDTGKGIDRNRLPRSSASSECREESREDSGGFMRKRSLGSQVADESMPMSISCKEGNLLKGEQEVWTFGADYDGVKQTIDESERWEMSSDKNGYFLDSGDLTTTNHERTYDNAKEKYPSVVVHGAQNGHSNQEEYDLKESDLKENTSTEFGSPEKDLEAILREKALENFKRFRGKRLEKSQSQMDEQISGVVCTKAATRSDNQRSEGCYYDNGGGTAERDSVPVPGIAHPNRSPEVEEHGQNSCNVTLSSRRNIIALSDNISGNSGDRNNEGDVTNKTQQTIKGSASVIKGVGKVDVTIGTLNGTSGEKTPKGLQISGVASSSSEVQVMFSRKADMPGSGASHGADSTQVNLDQSTHHPVTPDNSQFEQKTMSVMRGGEMVQVSYKVYIPKKPPALARRQLHR